MDREFGVGAYRLPHLAWISITVLQCGTGSYSQRTCVHAKRLQSLPSPGDPPDPGIKPTSLMSPTLAGRLFPTSTTWGAPQLRYNFVLISSVKHSDSVIHMHIYILFSASFPL